jgi:hypothetical protein
MVLTEGKRHDWIEQNPLDDCNCFLPQNAPRRSFLEVAQVEARLQAALLLDGEQRKLEWRDVRAIRESDEPATRLAGRYGVSETLIRRIRRARTALDRPHDSAHASAPSARRVLRRRSSPGVSGSCGPQGRLGTHRAGTARTPAGRPAAGSRGRQPRRLARAPRDPDLVSAAADVRIAPGRGRCAAAAGDVPARPHRLDAHDARLPAGARHGRSGG